MVSRSIRKGHPMEGCMHIRIVDGKIESTSPHFEIPENFTGVIHCRPEHMLTDDEFRETHPEDVEELDQFDQMWVGLWHREDGSHDVRSRINVRDDHHYLDMLCQIMSVWKKCNH